VWRDEAASRAPEARAHLQQSQLRTLLARLDTQVPFYREALRAKGIRPTDVRALDQLQFLPVTTKQDLRAQYPFGLLAVPPTLVNRVHATSGTKGKQTLVAYTAQDLRVWAQIAARMLHAAGCRPGEVWYVASGYGLFTGGLGAHAGAEFLGATVVPASSGNTNRLIQLMRDLPPAGIHCIPSYMLRVAEVAAAAGIDPRQFGLRFGSFGGEPWSEGLRRRVEETFGLEAFDVYGLSECFGPGVGFECEAHQGLHLSEDHFLIELLDPATGKPVSEGESGELTITTLTKEAMPLLRYRTGDLTRIMPGACPCGRTFRRMERISGRADDMLVIRGVNLFPSEVERVLLRFPELAADHRLVIDRSTTKGMMDHLTIEIESALAAAPDSPASTALKAAVERALREELGVGAQIALALPGSLPRSEGKAVRVLDRRSGDPR
jgi:phenylacetate-CoA ligase